MKQKLLATAALAALLATPLLAQNTQPITLDPGPKAEQNVDFKAAAAKLLADIPADVVTWEGGKVTSAEVRTLISGTLENALQNGMEVKPEQVSGVVYQAANTLLMQSLLYKEAIAKGFKADDEKAKAQLEEIRKQIGDEALKQKLQEFGKSEKEIIEDFSRTLAISTMVDALNKIEDDAAEKFYKANARFFTKLRAAHILAKFEDTENGKEPTPEIKAKAKAKIEQVQKLLKEGKDFAALAKEHSDCPSKEEGGDLGEFSEGEMIPKFEEALKKMKPGEISEPVETEFGYHIIKAGEKTSQKFEEVKEEIAEHLKEQNAQKVLMELTQKLMADAKVKWNVKPPQLPKLQIQQEPEQKQPAAEQPAKP